MLEPSISIVPESDGALGVDGVVTGVAGVVGVAGVAGVAGEVDAVGVEAVGEQPATILLTTSSVTARGTVHFFVDSCKIVFSLNILFR